MVTSCWNRRAVCKLKHVVVAVTYLSLLSSKARGDINVFPGELCPLACDSWIPACPEAAGMTELLCFCFTARLKQPIQRAECPTPDVEGRSPSLPVSQDTRVGDTWPRWLLVTFCRTSVHQQRLPLTTAPLRDNILTFFLVHNLILSNAITHMEYWLIRLYVVWHVRNCLDAFSRSQWDRATVGWGDVAQNGRLLITEIFCVEMSCNMHAFNNKLIVRNASYSSGLI